MAKKKIARKELLKESDEFLTFSRRLFRSIMENINHVAVGLGVFLCIILVIAGIRYFSEKSQVKAFGLMGQAVSKYESELRDNGQEKAYAAVKADFDLLLDEYAGKDAAKMARVVYAGICGDAGEPDRAIELYNAAIGDFSDDPSLKTLVLSGLAYAHEAKKDYKAATGCFEKIANDPDSVMRDEAFYNLGRLYNRMGDAEKSTNAYKKVVSDYPDSMYVELVREKVGATAEADATTAEEKGKG